MEKCIALVGAGYWGKNHLRNLYNLGLLGAVYDRDKKLVNKLKKEYPEVNFVESEDKILNSPDIKGVVIAVPALFHYEVSKEYLLADKDVLVEKPLSLKVKEAEELINISEKKKKILMVGHILQYHQAVIKLKELVDNGVLGDIRYIYSNRLNFGKIRTEENVLWSLAPHDISMILMMLNGERPVKVDAFGGTYITEGIPDTVITSLYFKNDVKSHIFVSWLNPFKEQKLVVIGTDKMAVFDDLSSNKLLVYPHTIQYKDGTLPVAMKGEPYSVELDIKEPLAEELLHFYNCIVSRKKPKTDGYEGLRVLEVLELADSKLKEKI